MIYIAYDIILHIALVLLLPYFLIRMLTVGKYRAGIPERLGFIKRHKLKALEGGGVAWFHAASVGETKAIIPVIKSFKRKNPRIKILFSTVTNTGQATAATDSSAVADSIIYFPLDLSWAVGRVIRKVKPRVFVAVEKELWPNAFRILSDRKVPIIIANATISERSFRRFARMSLLSGRLFRMISVFCARTEDDARRAKELGIGAEKIKVTGNIKFDLLPPLVDSAYLAALQRALGVEDDAVVIVAGSTHAGEEELLLKTYSRLQRDFTRLRLVIAPRHPERFNEVEGLIKKTGLAYSRRSKGAPSSVMLLDSVGELMNVYSFAAVAFVGGSLVPGVGGHNLLEPAYFGKPVVYGPHLSTYLGMAELLEREGGGFRAAGADGLYEIFKGLLSDEQSAAMAGAGALRVVVANRGAATRTADIIGSLLPEATVNQPPRSRLRSNLKNL